MAKYLVLVLVIVLVVWFFKKDRPARKSGGSAPKRGRAALPQPMVRCAHCGVHLPAAEALPGVQGLHYCSEDHRQAGPH